MLERAEDTSATGAERVFHKLVTRHAEDAAFYWARRIEDSLASQHDLRSLGRFELLLQANLACASRSTKERLRHQRPGATGRQRRLGRHLSPRQFVEDRRRDLCGRHFGAC
jgi:hypothetical protein